MELERAMIEGKAYEMSNAYPLCMHLHHLMGGGVVK